VEELPTERGEVDHVTVYRWVVPRSTPLSADAAPPDEARHRGPVVRR
jgi:hypothetical protein